MDAEKNLHIERHEGDEMIRGTLMGGQVRIMMCETTQMAQRAADIHNATPVCTAAMGRLMTATSMLGVMMKGENESVTVNIKGGGPMGTVVAVLGAAGAAIKQAMVQGFKRGVFSNEAGLGSSVMVHSNSNIKEPVKQGMWGIFEVFADTMVVCTLTALVVLTSGVYNLNTGAIAEGLGSDATLVAAAFNSVFSYGNIGSKFVAVAILLFAFTTVLGWNHYGTKAWEYLFGVKSVKVYKMIHLVMILFGALLTSSLAWDISDTFNGLMMIPNLIGVIVLSGLVRRITKNYLDRQKGLNVKPMLNVFDEE